MQGHTVVRGRGKPQAVVRSSPDALTCLCSLARDTWGRAILNPTQRAVLFNFWIPGDGQGGVEVLRTLLEGGWVNLGRLAGVFPVKGLIRGQLCQDHPSRAGTARWYPTQPFVKFF